MKEGMKNVLMGCCSLVMIVCLISCADKSKLHTTTNSVHSKGNVLKQMKAAYTWQRNNPISLNEKFDYDWARAVLYIGAMRAYKSTNDTAYLNGSITYSTNVNWQPGPRFRMADDLARCQIFEDIYASQKKDYMLASTKNRIDSIINVPMDGRKDWWWCDALFMAPPVLVRLTEETGDAKYNQFLNKMWWDTYDFLYDKQENLFFRDKSFFEKKTPNGNKLFWSRGNGWVMGGLVQLLERLPKNDASYKKYLEVYQKMSEKIAGLQQPDGLWRASLLDPNQVPVKETSGSSFYTFALAWGINNGVLDKKTYLPVVLKGWKAINDAVAPDGKLTWVQRVAAKPESVQQSDNQEYGTGAFLMAGTEMMKLGF